MAFVQDLAPEGSLDRLLPVLRVVELAFASAALNGGGAVAVEIVPFDTQGDPATTLELAGEIAGDPGFVAAIAAPDLPGQAGLVSPLSGAGVPVLSLSSRGAVPDAAAGSWLRLVAPLRTQAEVLGATVGRLRRAGEGVCRVAAPADGTVFQRVLRRSLPTDLPVTEAQGADQVDAAGCGVAVWTGDAAGGAELASALAAIEPRPPLLAGGPALRDPRFPELADGAPAIAVCSCADLSTSLDLDAQRFIQDFQTEFGRPPGPYGVEAWDLAHLVLEALVDGGPTREDVVRQLAPVTQVDGLGGPYLVEGGELADPAAFVRLYRVRGGRWLEVPMSVDA